MRNRVNSSYILAFKPQISDFAKNLKREGKVEERLLLVQMEKELAQEERKVKELEEQVKKREEEKVKALKISKDEMYKKCSKRLS